ncbi:hypothetical protein GCM10010178_79460 [Lentzea flava]|uniref:Uncharacterized protein n=2 Tax=Lentzea flava TaxID=103732 RepID=A0ABQ2VA00_9PSEU|nr:hypothetical protein GCM10010178_79460 [Lentzea flava]
MTWTVRAGWADVEVADHRGEALITASYISPAPEDLLGAVTRLLRGEPEARVRFEAEPAVYRWDFERDGDSACVRLVEQPSTEIWSTRQPLGALARVVVRCFDSVADRQGEDGYHREWRRPFPRAELEGLRAAWRAAEASGS